MAQNLCHASLAMSHAQSAQHPMGMQPLTALGEKSKGKHEINVSTAEIDERQHSPGYYKQTEAAAAFRQATQLSRL